MPAPSRNRVACAFTAAKRCRTDVRHQPSVTVMPIQHDRRDLHAYGKPVMDDVHHRAVPRDPRHRGDPRWPVPRGPRHREIPGDRRSAPCGREERAARGANSGRHTTTVRLGFRPCQGSIFRAPRHSMTTVDTPRQPATSSENWPVDISLLGRHRASESGAAGQREPIELMPRPAEVTGNNRYSGGVDSQSISV